MKKTGIVTKDFASLATALRDAGLVTEGNTHPEISAENAILVLLNDRNGRTLQDMARHASLRSFSYDDLIAVTRKLENEGKLVTSSVRNETVYSLRNMEGRPGRNLTEYTDTQLLDAALWDLMSDRRSRELRDVAEGVIQLAMHSQSHILVDGVPVKINLSNRTAIMERVIDLRKKKWFAVSGQGRGTSYSLMKHIQRPISVDAPAVEPKEETAMENEESSVPLNNFFETPESELPRIEDARPDWPEVEPAEDVVPVRVAMTPDPNDSFEVAIWKVMSDFKPATVKDIEHLLEGHHHINPKSIGPKISILYNLHDWFTREPVPGSKAFQYTLKEDNPMATTMVEMLARKHMADQSKKQTATDRIQVVIDDKPQVEVKAEKPQVEVKADAPLISIAVSLRGVPITDEEAGQIVDYLNSVDLTGPKVDDTALIRIETKLTIKGMQFSLDEAKMVFAELNRRGF